jgi:hypothetical protein
VQKKYTCDCKTTNPSGVEVSSATYTSSKIKKKESKDWCGDYSSSEGYNPANYYATGNTTTCTVK